MASIEKKIRKLYDAPRNIPAKYLISVLISIGCVERSAKGSHRGFKHPKLKYALTIPNQNPLYVGYVIEARKYIEQIRELENNEKES